MSAGRSGAGGPGSQAKTPASLAGPGCGSLLGPGGSHGVQSCHGCHRSPTAGCRCGAGRVWGWAALHPPARPGAPARSAPRSPAAAAGPGRHQIWNRKKKFSHQFTTVFGIAHICDCDYDDLRPITLTESGIHARPSAAGLVVVQ